MHPRNCEEAEAEKNSLYDCKRMGKKVALANVSWSSNRPERHSISIPNHKETFFYERNSNHGTL